LVDEDELVTWITGGIGITIWNACVYEFPMESSPKGILATTLGIFSATFSVLDI